jgi:hypothetical protein
MSAVRSYTRSVATPPDVHPSLLDAVPRRRPRYRWRTWMRGHVPWALVDLFPKGFKDCGQHEWSRYDEETDRCYHCEVGVRPHQPLHVSIDEKFRMELIRAAERGSEAAKAMIERFHANDRELGRRHWEPPAEIPTPPSRPERLFAQVSSLADAARRSARRLRSS